MNDLIWSRMVRDCLLGERRPPNDLMAWSADQAHLPCQTYPEHMRVLEQVGWGQRSFLITGGCGCGRRGFRASIIPARLRVPAKTV